jgi:hypothetical protein
MDKVIVECRECGGEGGCSFIFPTTNSEYTISTFKNKFHCPISGGRVVEPISIFEVKEV